MWKDKDLDYVLNALHNPTVNPSRYGASTTALRYYAENLILILNYVLLNPKPGVN